MSAPRISVEQVKQKMDAGAKVFFVDVRNPKAWDESDTKLPGALRTSLEDAHRHVNEFPGGAMIVAYCT